MSDITRLKYWVQKVLPLVYEDSLSYYELLGKVIDKINELIDSNNELGAELREIQGYYKEDLYNVVNDVLQKMADDGTIAAIISAYPRVAVNDEFYRHFIAECAESYILHAADFSYGGSNGAQRDTFNINEPWEINCSTFSMLMACGVTFENSCYGGGTNKISPYAFTDHEFFNWWRTPKPGHNPDTDEAWQYTNNIAEKLYNMGYTFAPEPDFSNLQTGDLLFIHNEMPYETHTFMDITHSGTFAYKTNDNHYVVWEVGDDRGPREAVYTKQKFINDLKLIARFPCLHGQVYDTKNMISNSIQEITINNQTKIRDCVSCRGNFKAGQYYTLVTKLTYTNVGVGNEGKAYPGIRDASDTGLMSDYNRTKWPEDDIYVLPFVPVVDTAKVVLDTRIAEAGIDKSCVCEWAAVYPGLSLYYKDPPEQIAKNITIEAETDFTVSASSSYNTAEYADLNYVIAGTFTTGRNKVATLTGIRRPLPVTPVDAVMGLSAGIADCGAYIDGRGGTSALYVYIPGDTAPERVYIHIHLPQLEHTF